MTEHELNIVKLADLIAREEETRYYLISKYSLIRLNALVEAHAIITGTKPIYYDQVEPEAAKDHVDLSKKTGDDNG